MSEYIVINKSVFYLENSDILPRSEGIEASNDLISSEKLQKDFIDEFMSYNILSENFRSEISKSKSKITDENVRLVANNYATSFQIIGSKKEKFRIIFSVTESNKDLFLKILNESIEDINEVIYTNMIQENEKILKLIKLVLNNEAEIAKQEVKEKKNLFLINNEIRIEYLKEQSMIAKALDLEENKTPTSGSNYLGDTDQNISTAEGTSVDISIGSKVPEYVRGYKALDKEISILKNRDLSKIEKYDNEFGEAIINLEKILENPFLDYFEEAMATLPNNYDFKAVQIDTRLANFDYQNKKLSLLILFIFIGFALPSMFFIFKSNYKLFHNN
tara:strand:+ start:19 stop:1014 length:996 start_codon:yes stop_codon:yes gene_type:complete